MVVQNNEPFVDDSFPPAPKSLYYNPGESKDQNHVVQWLRPHQINTEGDSKIKWAIFRTPLPSDISQGLFDRQSTVNSQNIYIL